MAEGANAVDFDHPKTYPIFGRSVHKPLTRSFESLIENRRDLDFEKLRRPIEEVGDQESELSGFEETEEPASSDIYITNDPCPHCARQGLDISSKSSRVNYQLGKDGSKFSPFVADSRSGCCFPFRAQCLLTDPENWSMNRIAALTTSLCELSSQCKVSNARVLLRVNDHLRSNEETRGWMLIVEGRTQEAVEAMLCKVKDKLVEAKAVEVVH